MPHAEATPSAPLLPPYDPHPHPTRHVRALTALPAARPAKAAARRPPGLNPPAFTRVSLNPRPLLQRLQQPLLGRFEHVILDIGIDQIDIPPPILPIAEGRADP